MPVLVMSICACVHVRVRACLSAYISVFHIH